LISVTLPPGFEKERKYVFHVILHELLGLEYSVDVSERDEWYLIEFGDRQIKIRDTFFASIPREGSYLSSEFLPTEVRSAKSPGITDTVCLYGADAFSSGDRGVECGIDLIGGAFFMLSRWEEAINENPDMHGRFPATASIAFKNGFLERPIVNEYSDLLKQWLLQIGVPQDALKTREFKLHLQCDVDTARFWTSQLSVFRKVGFRLFGQRSAAKAFKELSGFIRYLRTGEDPYHTFDLLIDLAERVDSKACFFFPIGGNDPFDNKQQLQQPHVRMIFDRIRSRGHETGMHYSYRSAHNAEMMRQESRAFLEFGPQEVLRSRQHFLTCKVPETWIAWEECGVRQEFGMGYPEAPGFRCGICHPFPLFDIRSRKMLSVYEIPLIAMDVTFRHYLNSSPEETIRHCRALKEVVMKHHGDFVFLWHNSSFGIDWQGWEGVPGAVLEFANAR
jgi:hypothetical protein